MISGDVGVLEQRRDFVLTRRHFIVPGFDRHAGPIELALDRGHERHHAIGNGAEILIFELLPFRRFRAKQRAAGVDQVRTRQVEVAIDQEIFLLRPAGGDNPFGVRAEQFQDADRLLRERFHRAQQRCFFVECFAGPAHERGRNDQRHRAAALEQPGRRRRIPRCVAARFEGAPHAARRKTRRVRFASDQFFAGKFRDRFAVGGGTEKRIVFLRGDAGQRLEPVRVMRRAVFDRPFLHRFRNRVSGREVERFGVRDGPPQRVIHVFRKAGLLHRVVEYEAAEHSLARAARFFRISNRPVANRTDRLAQNCRPHRDPLERFGTENLELRT